MSDRVSVIFVETKEQYEQLLTKEDLIIVYFSSENCNVCHAVFPKLMDLVDNYPVTVARINTDQHREIAGQNLIFTVPTILMINEGKEILRESRFINFSNIERILEILTCH